MRSQINPHPPEPSQSPKPKPSYFCVLLVQSMQREVCATLPVIPQQFLSRQLCGQPRTTHHVKDTPLDLFLLRAAGGLCASVGITNKSDQRLVVVGLADGLAVQHHPRSPLKRRRQVVGLSRDAVHIGVAVSLAALGRIRGGRAVGDDIPVQAARGGAVLGHRRGPSLSRRLHAVEEIPPQRTPGCGRIVAIPLNTTTLPHVAIAFFHSMLTSESPSAVSIFILFGISVGPVSENSDVDCARIHQVIDLRCGVGLAPGSQRFTVEIYSDWVLGQGNCQ